MESKSVIFGESSAKSDHSYELETHDRFEIPDGGYGWVIVLAVFLIDVSTWGSNLAYGIYLAFYMRTKLFTSSNELYGLIGGLAIGLGIACSPLITWLHGKLGVRVVMVIGAVLQLAANLLGSWAVNLWQILVTQGIMLGFGMTMTFIPATQLVPQWFRKKRTLAGGIAAAGSGAGGVMYNLAMSRITQQYSYKWALRAQGIMGFVTLCVAIALIRQRRNTAVRGKTTIVEMLAFTSFGFWLAVAWVMLTMFGYVVVKYTLADFTHSLGFSSAQGAVVSAMTSAGSFFIRPLIGLACDRYGAVTVSMGCSLLTCVLALAMWIPCRNYATAIAFGFLSGGLMGAIYTSCATIIARIAGLHLFPVFFGMVWFFLGVASIASPVIGMRLKTGAESPTQYQPVAIFVGCCYLGAAGCLWILRAWIMARDAMGGTASEPDEGEAYRKTVPVAMPLSYLFATSPKLV